MAKFQGRPNPSRASTLLRRTKTLWVWTRPGTSGRRPLPQKIP